MNANKKISIPTLNNSEMIGEEDFSYGNSNEQNGSRLKSLLNQYHNLSLRLF